MDDVMKMMDDLERGYAQVGLKMNAPGNVVTCALMRSCLNILIGDAGMTPDAAKDSMVEFIKGTRTRH
jgi:hypothetical protein